MGKASRRKKERRAENVLGREELLLRRLKARQCLHCGAARNGSVWCSKCARAGRWAARNNPRLGYPWRRDPRIQWPTQAQMAAYLDALEAQWAAEERAGV